MVLRIATLLCLLMSVADAQRPGVTIKIKEKSGFLGLGPPLYAVVSLDNEPGEYPLTSVNVNAGTQYFFLVKSEGNWIPDKDFVKEQLPNLSILQGERTYPVAWTGEPTPEDSTLLIGFPKDLRLNEPFMVQFRIGERLEQETFTVPTELWPGYERFSQLEQQVSAAVKAGSPEEAIRVSEVALGDASLEIFPGFSQIRQKRTASFQSYLDTRNRRVEELRVLTSVPLKDRLQQLSVIEPEYRFITDRLVKPSLGINADDEDVASVLRECSASVERIRALRDSLQKALEEEQTTWIIEGGATGRTGFLYQYMIEALAYAFSSLDFADTATFTMTLPPEIQERLAKQKVLESYQAFLRFCTERHQRGQDLFPEQFLRNLERDSSVFSLPYHAMLRAVQEYYAGRLDAALPSVFAVFRTCHEPLLNERFDELRIMIEIRSGRQSGTALGLIREALAEERAGNRDEAGEKFRQATAVAPDAAYAAFMLGRFYDRSHDPVRALPFLQRAYELDTLYLSAYRESAQLFQRSGTFKPMIDVLTRALARGNSYWEIEYNLGRAYMGDRNLEAAVQHFQQALGINPRSYDTHIQLGMAYQALGDYQKARERYNSAINLDPLRQTAVDLLTKLNELQRAP
jgi:tetratricopeptide (TPR) repeat protein